MDLLGITKSKITKKEYVENVHSLKITAVVLVACNTVKSNYQQNSRVLYTFISKKLFGQLLHISPHNFMFLKTFKSEFQY